MYTNGGDLEIFFLIRSEEWADRCPTHDKFDASGLLYFKFAMVSYMTARHQPN